MVRLDVVEVRLNIVGQEVQELVVTGMLTGDALLGLHVGAGSILIPTQFVQVVQVVGSA